MRPLSRLAVAASVLAFATPGSASAHPSPHVKTRAASGASRALPYTGGDPGWTALAGLGLLAAGTGLRVRLRAPRD